MPCSDGLAARVIGDENEWQFCSDSMMGWRVCALGAVGLPRGFWPPFERAQLCDALAFSFSDFSALARINALSLSLRHHHL